MSRTYAFGVALGLCFLASAVVAFTHHGDALRALLGVGQPARLTSDESEPLMATPKVAPQGAAQVPPQVVRKNTVPSRNPVGNAPPVAPNLGEKRKLFVPTAQGFVEIDRDNPVGDITRLIQDKNGPTMRGAMACVVRPENVAHPVVGPAHPTLIPRDGSVAREPGRIDLISRVYHVDRVYKSMQGPWGENRLELLDVESPELVWITGVRVSMLAADGHQPMPDWFMCHANFDFDSMEHARMFGIPHSRSERLFTLSQGQLEIAFPPGCGLPMMSNEKIRLITQALNLNFEHKEFDVRHHVHIDFVRDSELRAPMRPLYQLSANGLVSLDEGEVQYDFAADGNLASTGRLDSQCSPGQKASMTDEQTDEQGRRFTGHWLVKPGRHTYRTPVKKQFDLPWDTKAHYIAVHLHPTAESITLRDLTTGEDVFHSKAKNPDTLLGLEKVDFYSSEEGLTLFKDHEYELVSVYHNRGEVDVDSMAVLYIYAEDHAFRKPVRRVDVAGR